MTHDPSPAPAVLAYRGPSADHTINPLTQVPRLADAVATVSGRAVTMLGHEFEVVEQSSSAHLDDARAALTEFADAVDEQLAAGHRVIAVQGRCAASIATLPRVLSRRPDTVVVWTDAHADIHTPGSSNTDFLGGMAASGPLGWWDSGFGAGLPSSQFILLAARSIDPTEAEALAIEEHGIHVVGIDDPAARLRELVAGRPVHFHLDCDALEPGIVRTDYREPNGLTLTQLADVARMLATETEVVGVEVAEFEGDGAATAADLVQALAPLLRP